MRQFCMLHASAFPFAKILGNRLPILQQYYEKTGEQKNKHTLDYHQCRRCRRRRHRQRLQLFYLDDTVLSLSCLFNVLSAFVIDVMAVAPSLIQPAVCVRWVCCVCVICMLVLQVRGWWRLFAT